jgi:hypothetical protein
MLAQINNTPEPIYQQSSLDCADAGPESESLTGTVSDDSFNLSFTISSPGVDGFQENVQTTATVNPDGTLTGTYAGPNNTGLNGCPLNDSGTFAASPVPPQFNGTWTGNVVTICGGDCPFTSETISLTLAQSGLLITATGENNGEPFGLSGQVVGSYFTLPTFVSGFGREQAFSGYQPLTGTPIWLQDDVIGATGTVELQQ